MTPSIPGQIPASFPWRGWRSQDQQDAWGAPGLL